MSHEENGLMEKVHAIAFVREWCRKCAQHARTLARLSTDYPIKTIDLSTSQVEAEQLGVTEAPTYIVFVGDTEVYRTHDILDLT